MSLFAILPGSARAQATADTAPPQPMDPIVDEEFRFPVDDELAAEIETLIARLGSPLYKQRDAATRRLIEISVRAFPALRAIYHETDELEVRLRIEEIVRAAYFDHHVYNRNGFLGISMSFAPTRNRNARIPEGVAGLYVARVIENTGAARAGLKKDDVIIALDGKPLRGGGRELVNAFGDSIRSRPPGSVMALTVIRGSEKITIEATLGRCPEELARSGRVRGTSDLFHQTNARFPVWWAEHFRGSATQTPSDKRP